MKSFLTTAFGERRLRLRCLAISTRVNVILSNVVHGKSVPRSPRTRVLILRAKFAKLLSFLFFSSSSSEKVRNLLTTSWSSLARLSLVSWTCLDISVFYQCNIYLLAPLHRVDCHGVCVSVQSYYGSTGAEWRQRSELDIFYLILQSNPMSSFVQNKFNIGKERQPQCCR